MTYLLQRLHGFWILSDTTYFLLSFCLEFRSYSILPGKRPKIASLLTTVKHIHIIQGESQINEFSFKVIDITNINYTKEKLNENDRVQLHFNSSN